MFVLSVDIDEQKLAMAERLGFKPYHGEKVQAAFEASGANACLNQAIDALQPFGCLIMVGNASVDMTIRKEIYAKILRKQLRLEGSWNSDFSQKINDWKESIQAISEKRIVPEKLITHTIPFEQSPQAFEIIKQRNFYNKIMVVMK